MDNDENGSTVEVDIEDQLREIIKENDSIWIIAIKAFELGKNY